METMTIQYNPANAYARTIVSLIRQTKSIKVVNNFNGRKPNAKTLAAMEEARSSGNLKTYASVQEMMKDILN